MGENKLIELNKIDLLTIRELVSSNNLKFYVGPYQRGYRWVKTHIEYLLNDIWNSPKDKKYCLQPISVLRKPEEANCWELIDGQQRLTTIYLIIAYLSNEFKIKETSFYHLDYNTRTSTADFLKSIDKLISKWQKEVIKDDELDLWKSFQEKTGEKQGIENNIDNYHLFHAYLIIDKWFKESSISKKEGEAILAQKFHKKLLDQTQIIWYPIRDNGISVEDKFMNINANKISLNDAELIKALFIYKIQSKEEASNIKEFKKRKFANEWDQIENELHNDELWLFINNNDTDKYETRIGKLLDINASKVSSNGLGTYYIFDNNEELQNLNNWDKIKTYFNRIKEWYEDIKTYHKVGFIINSHIAQLKTLLSETKDMTKKEIENYLIKRIKSELNKTQVIEGEKIKKYELENLDYEKQSSECKTILLLYNVLLIEKTFPGQRFPFNLYQDKNWTLEHIHPQNPKDVETVKAWLHDFIKKAEELSETDVVIKINNFLKKLNKETGVNMGNEIDREITQFVDDYKDLFELHSIGNLVLLDGETNSSVSNKVFLAKRENILRTKEKGIEKYIPFGTLNCFMKKTTPSKNLNMEFWSNQDALYYTENIADVLRDYLPKVENR